MLGLGPGLPGAAVFRAPRRLPDLCPVQVPSSTLRILTTATPPFCHTGQKSGHLPRCHRLHTGLAPRPVCFGPEALAHLWGVRSVRVMLCLPFADQELPRATRSQEFPRGSCWSPFAARSLLSGSSPTCVQSHLQSALSCPPMFPDTRCLAGDGSRSPTHSGPTKGLLSWMMLVRGDTSHDRGTCLSAA